MIPYPAASLGRRTIHALRLLLVLASAVTCCLSPPARAQTAQQIGDQARQIERIQQEQQERQRQQLLEDARTRRERAPQALPEVPKPSLPATGVCREIKEIVLTGVTQLSQSERETLIAPYRDRCLQAADIERLLGDIVKAYIDRGFIAVRPYLRAQDLSGGRLEIMIVEGQVESILLEDGGKSSINLTTAFPGVVGGVLNLRDIEQGVEQVNRLAANNATMEILPGNEAGDSIVRVTNEPAFPFGFSASADNLGNKSTGVNELGATVNASNPLRLNDFLSYTHRESLPADRDQRRSVMDSAYYSVPFGYALFSLSYSASDYRTPVTLTSGNVFSSTGDSRATSARVDWVGYRDQAQKLTASAGITQKSNNNYLEGQLLEVSSRKLSILDVDLLWNRFIAGGALSFGVGYSQGLEIMGALSDDADLATASPHAQGGKYRASAGLFLPFKVGSLDASLSSQFNGQYALQGLYSTEQMLIGSYYTVRGFVNNSLSGNRAFYLRNDLALTFSDTPLPGVTLRPYLGFDIGRVGAYGDTVAGNLSGCALGVRINSKTLAADISLVQPLSVPNDMVKESARLLATITLSL